MKLRLFVRIEKPLNLEYLRILLRRFSPPVLDWAGKKNNA